jgi:hypothetical protein
MHKKRLLIGLCSWNSPSLLKICVDSVLSDLDLSQDGIAVVLNEADSESISYLRSKKIPFVCLPENRGVLAIDYLIPFVQNSEYFLNTNDDMVFQKGFSSKLISAMEKFYPCSVSLGLVENFFSNNPVVSVDSNLKNIFDEDSMELFQRKAANKEYDREYHLVGYNHPICVKSSDYFKVGCYSGNWDMDFYSGYCRDDMFPFLLKCLEKKFKFITLKDTHVYHQSSATMRKLGSSIRSQHNQDIFEKKTTISLPKFKEIIKAYASYSDL